MSDLDVAESGFEAFFGAPAFAPNETGRVWTMSDLCHIYTELDPEGAGRSRVTLFVEDLPGFTARAARYGIYAAYVARRAAEGRSKRDVVR
ncbi:hypothetical protein ACFQS2_04495 [Brachybacterium sp. GCM10030267]|uniref:hypothetical protein n=1 Tax=Brachybacterium sp. GCM10030267 TaxID=3273381 RepID=UPI00361CA9F2